MNQGAQLSLIFAELSEPIRIRMRADGWRMPENTVCVNEGTPWENPYSHHAMRDRVGAVKWFRALYDYDTEYRDEVVRVLRGKNLACLCPLDGPCHADVLLEWANTIVDEPQPTP